MNRRDLLSGAVLAAFLGASSSVRAAESAVRERQALSAARAAVLQAADRLARQDLTAAEAEVVAQVQAVLDGVPDLQTADPVYLRLLASLLERVCTNVAQASAGSPALAPIAAACQQVVDASVKLIVP